MVSENLNWIVSFRPFSILDIRLLETGSIPQLNIVDHTRLVYWHILEIGSIFHSNKYLLWIAFLFSFHMDRLLAFLMARALWFSSRLITHIWLFLWNYHFVGNVIQTKQSNGTSMAQYPFLEVSRQTKSSDWPLRRIFCHLSNPSWSWNKRVQGAPSQASMQRFNSLLCIDKPLVFRRYSVIMDFLFSLFFSLLFIQWYSDFVWKRGEDDVVMRGDSHSMYQIWRDVAFLSDNYLRGQYCNNRDEILFGDYRGDHTWE